MINNERDKLKELLKQKKELVEKIVEATRDYVRSTDSNLLYITDHAIARYLERVLKMNFPEDLSDEEKIYAGGIPPEQIRKEILSKEDELKILYGDLKYYNKGNIKLIADNLAILTVLYKDK